MKKILAWIATVLLAVYVLVMVGWLVSKLVVDTEILLITLAIIGIPVAGLFGISYLLREEE